jgi:hypothetical protein
MTNSLAGREKWVWHALKISYGVPHPLLSQLFGGTSGLSQKSIFIHFTLYWYFLSEEEDFAKE